MKNKTLLGLLAASALLLSGCNNNPQPSSSSAPSSDPSSGETTSETSGGTGDTSSSSEAVVVDYGTAEAPLSFAKLLEELAKEEFDGNYTKHQFFVAGKLENDPVAETGNNAGKYALDLLDGTNKLPVVHALIGNLELWGGDTVVMKAYIAKAEGDAYPMGYRATYNPKDYVPEGQNEPQILSVSARGEATLTQNIAEQVEVTGIGENLKNGDVVEFTAAIKASAEGYVLGDVKLDGVALEAVEGKYSFKAHGAMTLVITAVDTAKYATGVTITAEGEATSMKVGGELQLTAVVAGDEGVSQDVVWSVNDDELATVVDGKVTATKAGALVVTATAVAKKSDGTEVSDTYEITINQLSFAEITDKDVVIADKLAKVMGMDGRNLFVDDGSAGMLVYLPQADDTLAVGDSVKVGGTTSWYSKNLQVGAGTITAVKVEEAVTPSSDIAELSKEDAAGTYFNKNMTPHARFVLADDAGMEATADGNYVGFNYGETPMTVASFSPVKLTAGKTYSSVTGYLAGTTSSKLRIVVTDAVEKVVKKVFVNASADEVEENKTITLTASSSYIDDPVYTWSLNNTNAELSATTGAEVTLTGKVAGKVEVTVTADGVSAKKEITITEAPGDELVYKLDGTKTGSGNNYAGTASITQGSMSWKVQGNVEMNPWRLGGKSITAVNRAIYSTTAMDGEVNEIVIEFGSKTITVNSMKVDVYSTADAAASGEEDGDIATFAPTYVASDSVTITKADAKSWDKCFYRITLNVTNTTSSNKYAEFKGATFNCK